MRHHAPNLDPEVSAILDQVIADPNSILRRRPKVACASLLGLHEDKLSVGSSFLNDAERHLLARHRDEVGHLLYEAARTKLHDGGLLVCRVTSTSAFQPTGEWARRAGRVVSHAETLDVGRDLELVRRVRRDQSNLIAGSELAAASLRVVPCDEARIVLALTFNAEGNADSARLTLNSVLQNRPRARLAALAHMNLGLLAAAASEFDDALRSYTDACGAGSANDMAIAYRFIMALRGGERSSILESALELERVDPDGAQFDGALALLSADVASGDWKPTSDSLRTVPRLIDQLPKNARVIANVVA